MLLKLKRAQLAGQGRIKLQLGQRKPSVSCREAHAQAAAAAKQLVLGMRAAQDMSAEELEAIFAFTAASAEGVVSMLPHQAAQLSPVLALAFPAELPRDQQWCFIHGPVAHDTQACMGLSCPTQHSLASRDGLLAFARKHQAQLTQHTTANNKPPAQQHDKQQLPRETAGAADSCMSARLGPDPWRHGKQQSMLLSSPAAPSPAEGVVVTPAAEGVGNPAVQQWQWFSPPAAAQAAAAAAAAADYFAGSSGSRQALGSKSLQLGAQQGLLAGPQLDWGQLGQLGLGAPAASESLMQQALDTVRESTAARVAAEKAKL